MSDIKMIQLVTGQTVIGSVCGESSEQVTFDQPLGIRLVDQQDGVKVMFVPYDPINPEGRVKFFKTAIVSEPLDVPPNMTKAYMEQTSRIQLVTALDQLEGLR